MIISAGILNFGNTALLYTIRHFLPPAKIDLLAMILKIIKKNVYIPSDFNTIVRSKNALKVLRWNFTGGFGKNH